VYRREERERKNAMDDRVGDSPTERVEPRPRRYPPPQGVWYDILSKSNLLVPLENTILWHTGASLMTYFSRVKVGFAYIPTLLLLTVGRQSGELRRAALGYYVRDGNIIICGSLGGAAQHPDWYVNLQDHPLAWVRVNRETVAVDTRTATGAERKELWEWIKSMIPEYEAYERRAAGTREIPVVVCTPRRPVTLSTMR
jgi:F420H(2)-dependent quinone reductase